MPRLTATLKHLPITFLVFLACLTSINLQAAIPVTCWDAASEFNDSKNPDAANPSGVWSYGWKKELTGRFFLATTAYQIGSSESGWSSASGTPVIVHNPKPIQTTVNVNPILLRTGCLCLHPGPNGEYAALRFTAPAEGDYQVSGQFSALDDNEKGTTTDVWIVT